MTSPLPCDGPPATRPRTSRRVVLAVVLGAAASISVACSSSTTPADPSTGTSAPSGTIAGSTYEVVPDATVTAGLASVQRLAAEVATILPNDVEAANRKVREMYDEWYKIEGTVRAKEQDLYLQMEDGMAAIKGGAEAEKADKVALGIADLEAGVTAYLVKHP